MARCQHGVPYTWQLPWLAIEWPWLALAGPFLSPCSHKLAYRNHSSELVICLCTQLLMNKLVICLNSHMLCFVICHCRSLIGECLSGRLIIVWARQALVGWVLIWGCSFFVCLSVMGLRIRLYTRFLARAAHNVDWEDRRWWQAREQVWRYRRRLTAQQKDERQQDNSDRRRLAC